MEYGSDPNYKVQEVMEEPPQLIEEKEEESPNVGKVDSLSALINVWPNLILEMMNTQPLLAGHFLNTIAEIEKTSPPTIKVLFKKESQFQLVSNHKSTGQDLKEFLKKKLTNNNSFLMEMEYKPAPETEKEQSDTIEKKYDIPLSKSALLGEDELIQKVPIVGAIIELFDGRLIN